jgi:hypothetical protein
MLQNGLNGYFIKSAAKAAGSFRSSVYFPKWKEVTGSISITIKLGKSEQINY